MKRNIYVGRGIALHFFPQAEVSTKDGLIEYGRATNDNGGSAFVVLVDGNVVFESFESELAWIKFDALLPEQEN